MLACQVIEIQEAKKHTTVEALWEACLFSCKWGTPYWRCVILWWAWLPIVSELYSIWILTCWDHCFITLGDLYFRMSRNIHLFVVALRDIPENSCGGDWRWHWLRPVLIICHFLVCFLDKLLSLQTSLFLLCPFTWVECVPSYTFPEEHQIFGPYVILAQKRFKINAVRTLHKWQIIS